MRRDIAVRLPAVLSIGDEVGQRLQSGEPVVALESAVLTHGLPFPSNLEAVQRMDRAIRESGAVPAMCLIYEGKLLIGASFEIAEIVAAHPRREKASLRDIAKSLSSGVPAGLTVSATLFAAQVAGITTFATGGIGGVHIPAAAGDVSADLLQLGRASNVTVCSGAKSVLDIPRTLEFLETVGVPVLGYRTSTFPAFYLRSSGLPIPRADSPNEVARIVSTQRDLGIHTGVLLSNPIPEDKAIGEYEWNAWLGEARNASERDSIRGKAVTPYLLDRVAQLSGGRTVEANLALLESNARLAGEIAVELSG